MRNEARPAPRRRCVSLAAEPSRANSVKTLHACNVFADWCILLGGEREGTLFAGTGGVAGTTRPRGENSRPRLARRGRRRCSSSGTERQKIPRGDFRSAYWSGGVETVATSCYRVDASLSLSFIVSVVSCLGGLLSDTDGVFDSGNALF